MTDINRSEGYPANRPSGSQSCGFACHEVHPNLDRNATPTTKDNLSIARTKNVKLRIDLVVNAVTSCSSAHGSARRRVFPAASCSACRL